MSDLQPAVAVVVCSHNGAAVLPVALRALAAQRLGNHQMQLIVVDDGSTDSTAAIARAAGVTLVALSTSGGLAAARNAGVAACTAPVVAFTDDDCEPDADWLVQLIAPFADARVQGVAGRTVPASLDSLVFRYLERRDPLRPLPISVARAGGAKQRLLRYLKDDTGPSKPIPPGFPLYSVAGANMAFRRSLLDALGGFDASITFAGEEEDLCRRAHATYADPLLVYQPAALVRHHFRPGLRDVVRRARAYGGGTARSASRGDGQPIIFPAPLFAVALLGLAATRTQPRWRRAAPALIVTAYPGWLIETLRSGRVEPLVYLVIQLCQETAAMIGELQYLLRGA
jgi:glycosyltransferase involved in cell wall biosynthesis